MLALIGACLSTTPARGATLGQPVWVARYDGPGQHGTGPRTGQDFATVAYDAGSGAQLWVRRYDGPGRAGRDSAHALSVDALGNIYATGQGNFDYVTLRYDP